MKKINPSTSRANNMAHARSMFRFAAVSAMRGVWPNTTRQVYSFLFGSKGFSRAGEEMAQDQQAGLLVAVRVHVVALDHAVEGAAIDAEDFGRARAIAARDFQNVKQVTTLELIKRRQVFEQR